MVKTTELNEPLIRSADQIHAFVEEIKAVYMLDRPRNEENERRAVDRLNVTMPVVVTPLDDEFQPLDLQHFAITRDISEKGIGLVTASPIGRSHVKLTFEPCRGQSFEVIAKVAYCQGLGYYFKIGCEFA